MYPNYLKYYMVMWIYKPKHKKNFKLFNKQIRGIFNYYKKYNC